MTYDNFILIQPNSHTHALSAFLSQPPRGTGKKSSTHCSLSPFFLNAPRGIRLPTLSFLFFPPPRGTKQKSSTHCSVGRRPNFFFLTPLVAKSKSHQHTALPVLDRIFVFSTPPRGTERPNFCLFHATSWHRAMSSGNTLLYRSSTKFLPFPRHFVAQQKSVTHHSIGSRPKHFFFKWKFTPFYGTKQKVHELPKFCNRSSTETNNSSNDLINQTSKKKQA